MTSGGSNPPPCTISFNDHSLVDGEVGLRIDMGRWIYFNMCGHWCANPGLHGTCCVCSSLFIERYCSVCKYHD